MSFRCSLVIGLFVVERKCVILLRWCCIESVIIDRKGCHFVTCSLVIVLLVVERKVCNFVAVVFY